MVEGRFVCVNTNVEVGFVDGMDDDAKFWLPCLESFEAAFPIDVSQHLCLFFGFASYTYGALFRWFADSKDRGLFVVMDICVDGGLNPFCDVFVGHCD